MEKIRSYAGDLEMREGRDFYSCRVDKLSSWKSKYDEARLEGNQLMFYSNGELKKALTLEGIGARNIR